MNDPSHAPDAASLSRPRLTIDLDAIAANWRFMRSQAPSAETGAAVKADGYGLGMGPVSRRLYAEGCRTFYVANAVEGAELRRLLPPRVEARIVVLSGITPGDTALFRRHDLTPVLNARWQIDLWVSVRRDTDPPVHLFVDTGLNRLGMPQAELEAFLERPERLKKAGVGVVMSHLACGEDPDHPMNEAQRVRFLATLERVRAHLPETKGSLCNSAGVLLGADYHFDLTRPGIAIYGGAARVKASPSLACPVTLTAPILQVRDLGVGDTVGYGAEFTAEKPMRAATVALGYADGFLRAGWPGGYGVVKGVRAPVLGRVSMDLITVDVTEAGEAARPGALVEFLGPDAGLDEPARTMGTISYELLTRLGGRYTRAYVGASA